MPAWLKKSLIVLALLLIGAFGGQWCIQRWVFGKPKSQLERMLTDDFLDALVNSRLKYEDVNHLYGKPIFERTLGSTLTAHYEMGTQNPAFQRYRGRSGFSAVFKNGIIVKWLPITADFKE